MIVKTSNITQLNKSKEYFNKLINKECSFELKELKNSRTLKQNRALHLFFRFISNELNELGIEFNYQGLNGDYSTRYTENIVKNFIWRPIQVALFDIESTTKLNSEQINEIIDVLICWFSNKGVHLDFPSIETLIK